MPDWEFGSHFKEKCELSIQSQSHGENRHVGHGVTFRISLIMWEPNLHEIWLVLKKKTQLLVLRPKEVMSSIYSSPLNMILNMEGMRKRRRRRRKVPKKGIVHPFLVGRLLQRGIYPWRVIRVVLNIHNHNSQRKKKKKLGCCKTLLTSWKKNSNNSA